MYYFMRSRIVAELIEAFEVLRRSLPPGFGEDDNLDDDGGDGDGDVPTPPRNPSGPLPDVHVSPEVRREMDEVWEQTRRFMKLREVVERWNRYLRRARERHQIDKENELIDEICDKTDVAITITKIDIAIGLIILGRGRAPKPSPVPLPLPRPIGFPRPVGVP
jgi:hypothetical protein